MFVKRYLSYHSGQTDKFWQIETRGNATCVITQGTCGTSGKSTLRTFSTKGECLRFIDRVLHLRTLKGYLEGPAPLAYASKLPIAVQRSQIRKQILPSALGNFVFHPWHDAPLISIIVRPVHSAVARRGDPYRKVAGVFSTVAYALAWDSEEKNEAKTFVVWVPAVNLFGFWNREAQRLRVLPGISWTTLLQHFARYTSHDSLPDIYDCLKLWEHFDFIPDNFSQQVGEVLELTEAQGRKRVMLLAERYGPIFERTPVCHELNHAFHGVISLYYQIGQWLEEENDYVQAVQWFERSLSIVNQWNDFRSSVFIDLYLQLGFCYAETARFDLAMQYIDMYQRYNPVAWDSCSQIKASVHRVQQLYKDTVNSYLLSVDRTSNGRVESGKIIARALRGKPKDPVLHFNLSCFYSVTRQSGKALYHFEEALRNGYRSRDKILGEKDLNPIRNLKRFEAIRFRYC